jgi:Rieske Fe-S protein
MNRRDFLKEVMDGIQNSPNVSTSVVEKLTAPIPTVPTAGSPRQYRAGVCVFVMDARAWLCRDEIGFYAVDAACPHLGCTVRQVESQWVCPCHHSVFSASGTLEAGPAPHGLRYLYVDLDDAGNLVIRRDKTSSPDERFIA